MGKITKNRTIKSGAMFWALFFFRVKNPAPATPTYLWERNVVSLMPLSRFQIWIAETQGMSQE